jgi:2,5-dioxopentanoate dehydrogenase
MNVNDVLIRSSLAFEKYRKVSGGVRANLLETMADEIEALGDELIKIIGEECNLPEGRVLGERGRTCGQLRMFAQVARSGSHLGIRKDVALPDRTPLSRPDLRKVSIPLGPIVVFGASNFPLAYSTAGGDTASALAAGCTVVLKAHPAHPRTSSLVASALHKALHRHNMDEDIFIHVEASDFETGKLLVQHPNTAGVGFTGSVNGGRALAAYATERKNPIPVFTEMGSTNPVIFMNETSEENITSWAASLAGAITMGAGQFCTNPGLIFGVRSNDFERFYTQLSEKINAIQGVKMLNQGIHKNYLTKLASALDQKNIQLISHTNNNMEELVAVPSLAKTHGEIFEQNPVLHEEVFGPYSLIVEFDNYEQLTNALKQIDGQLTITFLADEVNLLSQKHLIDIAVQKAGRLIFNGVPTGVEVCDSMVHGGPSPATSDSRFTAVGSDAILRWLRPVCYQNFPLSLLPQELQD